MAEKSCFNSRQGARDFFFSNYAE